MDSISMSLVTLNQPTGFWESILNAFKGANGTYILAVILIALIVRVLFSLVDIVNKKVTMKNTDINAKMKPELEAIQKKYGHDQRLVQQKTSEVYKKYQFNMMGSCLPMLVAMVLQLVVFMTLWSSLQSVANYNIVEKYENMKNIYANVIALNEEENPQNTLIKDAITAAGDDVVVDVNFNLDDKKFNVYVSDGQSETAERFEIEMVENWTNESIYNLLEKYVIVPEEQTPSEGGEETPEVTPSSYVSNGYNQIFKKIAEDAAEEYYLNSQAGFLWIKNVYKPDSPTSPLFTKAEIKNYLSKYYTEDEKTLEKDNDFEGKIFDNVVIAGIGQKDLGHNGYYILTIVAVLSSFLSLWLSNKLMQGKNGSANKQSRMMYFIMPIIFGIFTFSYTSLFAVYIIVGQLVMIALTPLTTLVVRKWIEADAKRKKDKDVIEVDYRRKDK